MDIYIEEQDATARIRLKGKLDARGADAIEMKFIAATKNRDKVAIDMSEVDFLASLGIRMVVTAGKALARRGGKLVMFGAPDPVAKVITTAGLDEVVPLVADWAAAQTALA
jgi:anti-sigma B factor antagonist